MYIADMQTQRWRENFSKSKSLLFSKETAHRQIKQLHRDYTTEKFRQITVLVTVQEGKQSEKNFARFRVSESEILYMEILKPSETQ
jgi:hypothetical protein